MPNLSKVKSVNHVTHDVLRLRIEKPKDFKYVPGQAVDIAINKPGWDDKLSCFTFTSLPEDDFLEFTIKIYPQRKRVTNELLSIKAGDEVFVYKPFGDIHYKGDGIFIAGGAGITPFLAILKVLEKEGKIKNNKLIFANKKKEDIIDREYFEKLLDKNFINILSDEEVEGYEHGFVNADLIKKYAQKGLDYYYLCGPDPMMKAVEKHLESLGVKPEQIVKEGF